MSDITPTTNDLFKKLKAEADMLGISYNANATVNSLSKKIRAFKEAMDEGIVELHNPSTVTDTEQFKKKAIHNTAKKLIRVQISCNDPKLRVRGQIFRSISNKYVAVRKVVPLDTPTYVPQIIVENMRESKFLTFTKKKVNGGETSVPQEVATYNIVELPALGTKELERIAIRQQANEAVGDE